jgi:hypothetical protein
MRHALILGTIIIVAAAFAMPLGCGDDSGPAGFCGDGICTSWQAPYETCSTCEYDCGACPGCGDGTCSASENCGSCVSDCRCATGQVCSGGSCVTNPTCGDGTCNGTETCSTCEADCGACPPECTQAACTANSLVCGCIAPARCVWNSALRVGSCSGGGCGDGACGSGETCTTCEADCGPCGGCTDHYDCDSNSLCLYSRCELAWGRSYTVTIYDGQIMEREPSTGACWDEPGCDAPDTKVTLTLDGTPHTTAEASNTYNPLWNYGFTAVISSSSMVSAVMIDVDTLFDDTMFTWAASPITINYLKDGNIQYVDATETVNLINVFIEPVL